MIYRQLANVEPWHTFLTQTAAELGLPGPLIEEGQQQSTKPSLLTAQLTDQQTQ